jgi:hypothetical protein
LRKILVYSMFAVLVGLLLVLVPLITLLSVGTEDHYQPAAVLSRGIQKLDGSGSQKSKSYNSTLESLAVSWAIAVAGFMVIRRRRPRSERHYMLGQWPY